ncbi:hypothetical protein, partial [Prevotella histicola]|uniref:hypothetical protein n=1 Tax=Prevotella histicola TaxID=470565 RepID=UPI0040572907
LGLKYFDRVGQISVAFPALTLAPPEGEKEETEEMKQGEGLSDHYHSGGVKNESYLVQDKEDNSRLQSFRPKWRH